MRINLPLIGIQTAFVVLMFGCTGSGADGAGGAGGAGATSTTTASGKTATTSTGATSTGSLGTTTTTSTGGGVPTVSLMLDNTTVAAGGTAQGAVTVTNFVLEAPSATNKPGHGHYHVYLDGASGGSYLVANQIPTVPIHIPASAAVGPHTLRISLSSNDHVPLSPAVEDVINITVQ